MYVRHLMNLDEYKHMNEEELTRLMFSFCDVQLSKACLALSRPSSAGYKYISMPSHGDSGVFVLEQIFRSTNSTDCS